MKISSSTTGSETPSRDALNPSKIPVVGKVFYGWWIVAAGVALSMMSGGMYVYGFSAFFLPLTREFGWSRASLSGVVAIARLEGGVLSPLVGYLIDRYGPRMLMLVGISMMGIGFIILSRVNSLVMFYVVFILVVSGGSSFAIGTPVQTAVANWFIKKRGRATGILMSGFGLGGAITPLIVLLIASFGWRTTMVVCGLTLMLIGLPLAMVIRHRPEDSGLLPDGEDPSTHKEAASKDHVAAESQSRALHGHGGFIGRFREETRDVNLEPREALKTRAFWFIALAFGLSMLTSGLITVHYIPFLVTDIGLSDSMAASVLAFHAVTSVVSRLGVGWVGDIINKRYLYALCMGAQVIALLLLANAHSLAAVMPAAFLMALAYGGPIPLRPAIQGDYFGRKNFATIGGWLRIVDLPGIVAGPVFAGFVYDITGSYSLGFIVVAFTTALAGLAILLVRRPEPQLAEAPQAP
ncbi:MAG: MFS transporter [Dehalococcoidia bacterium]|nr:MFS transporter [Dehalococcoidia bacterium]